MDVDYEVDRILFHGLVAEDKKKWKSHNQSFLWSHPLQIHRLGRKFEDEEIIVRMCQPNHLVTIIYRGCNT